MATKKKVTTAVEDTKVTKNYDDKIQYCLKVLEYDTAKQVYIDKLCALEVPRHYKLTFGPGISMPAKGAQRQQQWAGIDTPTTKGSMLRLYDGVQQRGVIPNVLSFHETEHVSIVNFPLS